MHAQTLQRQNFTTDEGLPQNSVHAVLQTRDGFLWAATEGGVVRFDGVRFAAYGTANEPAFTSNDSCCLAQTADGALWIGTSDGLCAGRMATLTTWAPVPFWMKPQSRLAVCWCSRQTACSVCMPCRQQRSRCRLGCRPLRLAPLPMARLSQPQVPCCLRAQGDGFVSAGRLPAAPVELLQDGANRIWLRTASAVWVSAGAGGWHTWQVGSALPGGRLLSLLRAGSTVLASTNLGLFSCRSMEVRPGRYLSSRRQQSSVDDRRQRRRSVVRHRYAGSRCPAHTCHR